MEKFVLSGASSGVKGHNIVDDSAGPEVVYLPDCMRVGIFIHEGINSLFPVYGNNGRLIFRKNILSPDPCGFYMDLKNGVYLATLNSGRSRAARRITINLP